MFPLRWVKILHGIIFGISFYKVDDNIASVPILKEASSSQVKVLEFLISLDMLFV